MIVLILWFNLDSQLCYESPPNCKLFRCLYVVPEVSNKSDLPQVSYLLSNSSPIKEIKAEACQMKHSTLLCIIAL